MKKEVITGIVAFTFSTVASSNILVKSCTFETNNIAVSILALASLLLIALHISTTMIFKPNKMWFISKAIIIPEIISVCLLLIWKPAIGFIEIALVILSTAFSLRSTKGKTKAKISIIMIKRLLRGINASITLCSLILIPSIIIMTPYLRNSGKALITIPTHEISHTNDYHIPDKWSLITITQKTEFIEEFSEILASELNMDTVGLSFAIAAHIFFFLSLGFSGWLVFILILVDFFALSAYAECEKCEVASILIVLASIIIPAIFILKN